MTREEDKSRADLSGRNSQTQNTKVFSAVHLLDQRVSNPCTRTTLLTGMLSSLSHIPISDMYVQYVREHHV